jgi:peptidoglycan/LPS O-acetylase OafA/YrhL
LRRLTRLEPPYIIALVIFFIANVWVLHAYSFKSLLPHFFASMAYLHNIIYQSFSWILPVAWSLEVEVQFYVLAPLFFLFFSKTTKARKKFIYFDVCNTIQSSKEDYSFVCNNSRKLLLV